MEPVIFVTSLLLAAASPGDIDHSQGQTSGSSQPPAAESKDDAKPAQSSSATRKPRTTSPAGTTPMPPMPNIDKGIQLPPNKAPETPSAGEPDKPVPDAAKPDDDSVKPVPGAPSKPGEPGVRPLSGA